MQYIIHIKHQRKLGLKKSYIIKPIETINLTDLTWRRRGEFRGCVGQFIAIEISDKRSHPFIVLLEVFPVHFILRLLRQSKGLFKKMPKKRLQWISKYYQKYLVELLQPMGHKIYELYHIFLIFFSRYTLILFEAVWLVPLIELLGMATRRSDVIKKK